MANYDRLSTYLPVDFIDSLGTQFEDKTLFAKQISTFLSAYYTTTEEYIILKWDTTQEHFFSYLNAGDSYGRSSSGPGAGSRG